MLARQVALLTPSESSAPTQLLSCQHFVRVSPLPATLMDLPASVANKRLTAELSPLAATLTKNRGVGVPRGTPPSASVKIAVLSFHALTNCPLFPREEQPLCFHALTNCPFRKSFLLTFMHRMGGVGGSGELSSQRFSTHALSALDRELSYRCSAVHPLQNAAECPC